MPGICVATCGGPKGSVEIITLPRSGYPSETARSAESWFASPLKTTLSMPVLRVTRCRGASLRFVAFSSSGCADSSTQIRRQHLARLVVDRGADAVDEETHARERRHRDRDREHQHAELAGFPFAEQRAQGDGECVHAGY